MTESQSSKKPEACSEDAQTVYVLEGEPDEVFDAQGNRIQLTKEQEEYIKNHE